MALTPDRIQDVQPESWMDGLDKVQKFSCQGPWDSACRHNWTSQDRRLVFDDRLGTPEPEVATVLPADGKTAQDMNLDATDIIAIFKRRNYNAFICVGITSNILRLWDSVFNTSAWPNVASTSFIPLNWRYCIRLIHDMSLRLASAILV